ncbi:hypothetical protein [Burkholderia ambifaria]|uniref:hypothetical protein n=1 Tax=Burkholderia ambifaria TaxID=152480 RepID=UPI0002D60D70|nr:hypothetical protein [Burkholderia ambifaria]
MSLLMNGDFFYENDRICGRSACFVRCDGIRMNARFNPDVMRGELNGITGRRLNSRIEKQKETSPVVRHE